MNVKQIVTGKFQEANVLQIHPNKGLSQKEIDAQVNALPWGAISEAISGVIEEGSRPFVCSSKFLESKTAEERATLLHEFDLCAKFGPAKDISRARRYKRSKSLGLYPSPGLLCCIDEVPVVWDTFQHVT